MKSRFPAKKNALSNQHGFTLIEIMASLVILGVLTSVVAHRYNELEASSEIVAISVGVRELNTREMLSWLDSKLSPSGYPGDEGLFGGIDKDLGPDYRWDDGPRAGGGTLRFGSQAVLLQRISSNSSSPGRWQ